MQNKSKSISQIEQEAINYTNSRKEITKPILRKIKITLYLFYILIIYNMLRNHSLNTYLRIVI